MDTFLQLNRDKLRPFFIRVSLILVGLVLIIFAIPYLAGYPPNQQLIFTVIATAGIGFPVLIIFLGYLSWLVNRNAKQRAFSTAPFNQIHEINFYKAYECENSKWSFTEEIKKGKLNDFPFTVNISKEKRNILEFDIPVEWQKLEKSEYSRLSEKFQQYNVQFGFGSLIKQYNLKNLRVQTISDLKQDLEFITELLLQEGFKPRR